MSDTFSMEEHKWTAGELIREGLIMIVVASIAVGLLSVFHSFRYVIGL